LAPQDGQGYVFRDQYSVGSDGGRRHDAAIAQALTGIAWGCVPSLSQLGDYLSDYPLRLVVENTPTHKSNRLVTYFWSFARGFLLYVLVAEDPLSNEAE